MRARSIAIIAVSLLLIAGATGFQVRGQILQLLGADRPIPGSAPVAIGNTWACPSGGLSAYRSDMVYYPWYYPAAVPVGIKPTRCYRTASDAESAGFRLAPPPTGGVVLEGVYLVPAGGQTKSVCQDAANQLGIVIPCPTLLPVEGSQRGFLCPPGPLTSSKCSPNTGTLPDGFLMPFSLTTPPDYPGAQAWFGSGQVRMAITALPSSSQTAQQNSNSCTGGNAGPTVMGRPTLWTTCSGDPSMGVVNLTWEIDKASYAIGSSDETAAGRRMVPVPCVEIGPSVAGRRLGDLEAPAEISGLEVLDPTTLTLDKLGLGLENRCGAARSGYAVQAARLIEAQSRDGRHLVGIRAS